MRRAKTRLLLAAWHTMQQARDQPGEKSVKEIDNVRPPLLQHPPSCNTLALFYATFHYLVLLLNFALYIKLDY